MELEPGMALLLRIKDWAHLFENNRTRELKHMDWVPIPNRMDGDGYTELVDHPEGAAHFGAWIAIVEVASRCDPRGTLLRDGSRPHDSRSLERLTRIAASVFDVAIPRLISIGWLESEVIVSNEVATIPQASAGIPQGDASSRARAERNGTERNGRTNTPPAGGGEIEGEEAPQRLRDEAQSGAGGSPDGEAMTPGFAEFWAEWPRHKRKKGRSKCLRIWKRNGLDRIAPRIVDAVRRFKASPGWREQGGQFVPGPEPWLNDESWEVPADALAAGGSPDGDRDSPGFDRREPTEADLRRALGLGPDEPLPADLAENEI